MNFNDEESLCTDLIVVGKVQSAFVPPDHIIDNIYLGSEDSAHTKEELQKLNIKHILIVASEPVLHFPEDFKYWRIGIEDGHTTNIKRHFPYAMEAIDSSQDTSDGGNILIHCVSGVSRSATIVIAYLMKVHGKTLEEAITYVRSKRSIIRPNRGFERQLRQYACELSEEGRSI